MTAIKRIAVVLSANGILMTLLVSLNRHISGYALYIFVPALFLVYPALYLPFKHGFIALMLTAALVEVTLPVQTGTFLVLATVAGLTLDRYRHRLRSESLGYATGTTLAVNLGLCIALSMMVTVTHPTRVLADVLVSSLLILLATGWFFSLQHASLGWLQVRPHSDEF